MKYYVIEPSYKKSVIEYTLFKRQVEGDMQFLRKELGWRWGSFGVAVPETEEEAVPDIESSIGERFFWDHISFLGGSEANSTNLVAVEY